MRKSVALLVPLLVPCGVLAAPLEAISVRDLSPFSLSHPVLNTHARPSAFQISFDYQLANSQYYKTLGDDSIALDAQTELATFSLSAPINDKWSYSIEASYADVSGGFSDSFIESWHDTFGLPNGSRDKYAQDLMRLQYQRDGLLLVDESEAFSGLTDAQVAFKYALSEDSALNVFVNLPTGDGDTLLGSDVIDLGVSWQGIHTSESGWRTSTQVGVIALGDKGLLEAEARTAAAFGQVAFAWPVSEQVVLKLQVDAHTAYYDSPLSPLGKNAVMLGMGGSVLLGRQWQLDIMVSEDIAVEASPDVGLHMRLKWRAGQD
jgi:hypothetical protein